MLFTEILFATQTLTLQCASFIVECTTGRPGCCLENATNTCKDAGTCQEVQLRCMQSLLTFHHSSFSALHLPSHRALLANQVAVATFLPTLNSCNNTGSCQALLTHGIHPEPSSRHSASVTPAAVSRLPPTSVRTRGIVRQHDTQSTSCRILPGILF